VRLSDEQRYRYGLPLAALAASLVLLLLYVVLGGLSFKPLAVRDPCDSRPGVWKDVSGATAIAQAVALSAVDGAACQLGISRETLTLALTSKANLDDFGRSYHISAGRIEKALRDGLSRAVSDAEDADVLNGIEGAILHQAVDHFPLDRLIEAIRDADISW
jgi:hypothetical protein